ncbi:TonB family protein [Corallincola holothuriorum]|uniref:TonB family protein n=1 Tax=Corallincola holothuriorum TaxID=2282215 RepID=A0A368N3Z2_9GAMM|nr:TonB family protein [Corallincola holothuriorum]RCU45287.1 TonB family protein [Corallincola holothuriorum]
MKKLIMTVAVLFLSATGCVSEPQLVQNENRCEGFEATPAYQLEGAARKSVVPVSRVSPQYPGRNGKPGKPGFAKVILDVNAEGEPINIQIVESWPNARYGKATMRAIKQWKYQPLILDDKAVVSLCHQVTMNFEKKPEEGVAKTS